ncbi:MAG: hypothetical protein RSF88_06155, partial [Lachnospiraceae bacterium]
ICFLCVPGMILDGYKNMYEHQRFLDLSDYIEQVLYSFKSNHKILAALYETKTLYSAGKMYDAITYAINYIETGNAEQDLYKEALEQIEKEYPNRQLYAAHEFMRTVEKNGGEDYNSIDMILKNKNVWSDNIILLQNEKKAGRFKIIIAAIITILIALLFHAVYRKMPEQFSIVAHPATQLATTLFLILDIIIYRRANKEIAKSWIERENEEKDEKIIRYFKMIAEYDEKKERKKSAFMAAPCFIVVIPMIIAGWNYAAIVMGMIGLFMLYQHKVGYKTAYNCIVKEINLSFPQWLMTVALLLQTNNVQVAIAKTQKAAPAVLKLELETMQAELKEHPGSAEPYKKFLSLYKLSTVQSAMKMLYSISEAGTGDTQTQVNSLVERNIKLLDQSEKMLNEKSMTGITGIFYLPQLTLCMQVMVNMVVFMMSFFLNMTL